MSRRLSHEPHPKCRPYLRCQPGPLWRPHLAYPGAYTASSTGGALNASGGDLMRQGFAQGTAQSSAQILDKFLNIMPTITIREGHRVKVYLSSDLALPDYNNHKMPSDL